MEIWFSENQTRDLSFSVKCRRTLFRKKSAYQDVMVLETSTLGRILVIDGTVQTTELDEFVYHEMLAHVPLCVHPNPRRVLIVGGGDGGTVREALKHRDVLHIHLVEMDPAVLQAAKEHLPNLAACLDHPKVSVTVGDGVRYVMSTEERYDVVLVDSTDPVGMAKPLFEAEFYAAVAQVLNPDGIIVAQTESPFLHAPLMAQVTRAARQAFPVVATYLAPIPTYPGGLWSFTAASHALDPKIPRRPAPEGLRYYSADVHAAAFRLPPFVRQIVGQTASSAGAEA